MYDKQITELGNQLLKETPKQTGHGVEFIDLPHSLLPGTDMQRRILNQKDSRGVCDACIDWLKKSGPEARAIFTGAPGGGKSCNLIYVLRMLLLRAETVLFASRQNYL